jgi:hypothetical protein
VIHVFVTSVNTAADVLHLTPCLQQLLVKGKWTFDLDDCDKVLRIESETGNVYAVIQLLRKSGYDCEVMRN